MLALVAGLVLFLGTHSIRIFAYDWRESMRQRLGQLTWRGLYSLVSLLGFALIIWGYGAARLSPVVIWVPPLWMAHLSALLLLFAFILVAAAYVPGNHIKAKLGHPLLAAVKLWALAHLLCNGMLADMLLFGGFLVWAIVDFAVSRRRDRAEGVTYPAVGAVRDIVVVIVGVAVYVAFALWLHERLIGVAPFG